MNPILMTSFRLKWTYIVKLSFVLLCILHIMVMSYFSNIRECKNQPVVHKMDSNIQENYINIKHKLNYDIRLRRSQCPNNAIYPRLARNASSHRRIIIILTTMRSGSSYISRILTMNKYSNLLFEPIILLDLFYKGTIDFSVIRDFLKNLASCNYIKAMNPLHLNLSNVSHARTLKMVFLRNNVLGRIEDVNLELIEQKEAECRRNGSVLVMKVIRILPDHMPAFQEFMKSQFLSVYDPHLVFLIRDPRGVMQSRYTLSKHTTMNNIYVKISTTIYCGMMRSLIDHVISSSDLSRTTMIRYEDIAIMKSTMSRCLFSKLKLDHCNDTHNYISQASNNKNKDTSNTMVNRESYYYSTSRLNSTVTAEDWREKLNISKVLEIQQIPACKEILTEHGYLLVTTRDLLKQRERSLVSYD